MVHQHPASPALPCWLPGVGQARKAHWGASPAPHAASFALQCAQHCELCFYPAWQYPAHGALLLQPPQLRALLKRGVQESPQCPALLQCGGQAQECGTLCPGSHPADSPLRILSPVGHCQLSRHCTHTFHSAVTSTPVLGNPGETSSCGLLAAWEGPPQRFLEPLEQRLGSLPCWGARQAAPHPVFVHEGHRLIRL